MPTPDTFAGRLSAIMAHQGITPAALARRSGVPISTLSRLLSGQRQPTLATAALLARALGIPIDSLAP